MLVAEGRLWCRRGGPVSSTHTLSETPEVLGASKTSQRHPGGAGEILRVGQTAGEGRGCVGPGPSVELLLLQLPGESLLSEPVSLSV